MDRQQQIVANELLRNLYLIAEQKDFNAQIDDLKNKILEHNNTIFVQQRLKAPVSTLKKFEENPNYQHVWNSMKDIFGLMAVVENNNDVDNLIEFFEKNFEKFKNPFSKMFISDYRKSCIRRETKIAKEYIFQSPNGRGYQTNDSYKGVKINLMINNVPVEIQIKTLPQYIAHFATHDSIYKHPLMRDDVERYYVSDKLFPYFETFAYLRHNRKNLSSKQIQQVELDIKQIYERNLQIYSKYLPVFNETRTEYGVAFYLFEHRQEFLRDAQFDSEILSTRLASLKIKQVYEYIYDEMTKKLPNLSGTQLLSKTVDALLEMPYEKFKQTLKQISGKYRHGAALITGIFDVLRPSDIKLFEELNKIFRQVTVGVLDDKISASYLGRKPIFDAFCRAKQVADCRGVTSSTVLADGKIAPNISAGPLQLDEEEKKAYNISYLSGVFDGFHPGHSEHLSMIADRSEKVFVGVKTDAFSKKVKGKTTINSQKDRLLVIRGQKCVTSAFYTDFDILPPKTLVDKMEQVISGGGHCAIFLGDSWFSKRDEKSNKSLAELEKLVEQHPKIVLTTTPRENGKTLSSTALRDKLEVAQKEGNAPYEIFDLGNEL